ncbi:DNA primase [Streptomyces sp. NPDC055709]
MNNRLTIGLAVGAGYLLGRTKKAKLAFAVGTMVAGKRLQLNPRALLDSVTRQLQNNPQFKEIGDQLREDLRGVGKAATGAIVNRQIGGLADRLHERTLGVQDRVAGVTGAVDDVQEKTRSSVPEQASGDRSAKKPAAKSSAAKKAPGESTGRAAAKKAAPQRTSSGSSANGKRTAARKTAARKTAAPKTAARKTAARASSTRGGRSDA